MLYLYHVNQFSYHEIHGQLTVGRTTGEVVCGDDGRMSGKHAQILIEGGQLFIEDLGSKNKTIVNRIEIPANQRVKIKPYCLVETGSQQFIITEKKDLNIQQLNEIMDHHMKKTVVKLEPDKTSTGISVKAPAEVVPVTPLDLLKKKEEEIVKIQGEIQVLEQKAKEDLARMEEEKEKYLFTAKMKKAELLKKAADIKAEIEIKRAEFEKERQEAEQKKKKLINLKDLEQEEAPASTEELPE